MLVLVKEHSRSLWTQSSNLPAFAGHSFSHSGLSATVRSVTASGNINTIAFPERVRLSGTDVGPSLGGTMVLGGDNYLD